MKLFRKIYGDAANGNGRGQARGSVLILHGLFGQGRNWHTMAATLSARLHMQVIAADLRNHGRSPRAPSMSWEAMSRDDLRGLIADSGPDGVHLVGHSLGGKVAMHAVLTVPGVAEAVRTLAVVDIAPKPYPAPPELLRCCVAMAAVNSSPDRPTDQDAVFRALTGPHGLSESVARFLMTNLRRKEDSRGGTLQFDLPLDVLVHFLHTQSGRNIFGGPGEEDEEDEEDTCREKKAKSKGPGVPTLVVRGARSNYVNDDDLATFRKLFGKDMVRVKTIEGAGHWVHSQQPEIFLQTLVDFIKAC